MKAGIFRFLLLLSLIVCCCGYCHAEGSSRTDRRLITEGNRLYKEGKFSNAAKKYEEALRINPSSPVAKYNLGLSQIKQVANPKDTTQRNKDLLAKASQNLTAVASLSGDQKSLASKANYNLGNLSFNMEDYGSAIKFYKQALRLNPDADNARKNLRIAQLKQQNQDQNKDDNQNQDKDKEQQQDKDQNKDQNQDQKQDQQQNQQQQNQMNQQTADQILQAMENREAATRAKFNASKAEKSAHNKSLKNW